MDEYSFKLVVAIITNMEQIRSFVERTTGELFPLYYQIEIPKNFKVMEGHTLENLDPQTTRVPKRDSLKENLIVMLADIERAMGILDPLERIEVLLSLDSQYSKKSKQEDTIKISESVCNIIDKMVHYLNGTS